MVNVPGQELKRYYFTSQQIQKQNANGLLRMSLMMNLKDCLDLVKLLFLKFCYSNININFDIGVREGLIDYTLRSMRASVSRALRYILSKFGEQSALADKNTCLLTRLYKNKNKTRSFPRWTIGLLHDQILQD